MIQIWMKNGVKKTPLIKRFTTMPIIRAERKLNKTFTSQKRVKFHSPQECQKFWGLSVAKMQLSQCNFQVDNSALVITLVLENLNVTDGAKKFLLKRPKSKQFDDRS